MMSATLRMISTRACHPIRSHSSWNAFAAATASSTSFGVAWEKRPMMMSLSIGEGSSYFSSVHRSSPLTTNGYSLPSSPFIRSAASSYLLCSSSLSADMVA